MLVEEANVLCRGRDAGLLEHPVEAPLEAQPACPKQQPATVSTSQPASQTWRWPSCLCHPARAKSLHKTNDDDTAGLTGRGSYLL